MIIKAIKVIIYLLPVILLGWLINNHFAPFGYLEIDNDLSNRSPLISSLYPSERVSTIETKHGLSFQELKSGVVYFDVSMPRIFSEAVVLVVFQNESQPLFELGALKSSDEWVFEMKPLEAQLIDNVNWEETRDGNERLIQKDYQYDSIEDFKSQIKESPANTLLYFNDSLRKLYKPELEYLYDLKYDTNLDDPEISYILTNYTPPVDKDEWKRATVVFDLASVFIDQDDNNTIQFMLSTPATEINQEYVKIESIHATLKKDPLSISNVIPRAKDFINRQTSDN